ncbi:helix-turn-helix domain-containing protein [Sphingosinicella sp. LHD-64]|uniref:helix-turn-helix domain-containing protein n=1 Tax=Sphingosinicella sp. LHD-64 TaxID=3072139 RepID=UPI00280D30C7|nr:helix-turn-helix domain-containing protein [Sphingosinicella sp. LHD-64]MDQ8755432.1 helix-turn-helix domain-containing protein [Sphingosinicella sp. LHD-64]
MSSNGTTAAPSAPERLMVSAEEVSALTAYAASLGEVPPVADGRLTLADYFRLVQRIAVAGQDETCHLSRRTLKPGTSDFVVETIGGARDLEDAMRRIARAYNLVHGGDYNRVERRRDAIAYVVDDAGFPYAVGRDSGAVHALMEGVLIFLNLLLSRVVGADLEASLRSVRTRRHARTAPDGFLAIWKAPVRCGSAAYVLEYDLAAARLPVVANAAEAGRAAHVYEAVAALIAKRERAAEPRDFPGRVKAALISGASDQAEVARLLGVSVATLRRRLGEASLTYRSLRAEVLNMQARTLLAGRRHPGDVAEQLGFSDGRSFARAFKAWNGVTPARYAAGPPAQDRI